jgi:thiol-disulfide isomerase/thioredoxin
MSSIIARGLPLSIIALALLGCSSSAPPTASTPGEHDVLPADMPLLGEDREAGEPVTLGAMIGQRIAVIDFWASWCKPCRKTLPKAQALAAEVPGERVAVIAVNVGEKPAQVAEYRAELGLRLPVAFDRDMELARRLGVSSLPAVLVIDRRRRVVHRGKSVDDKVHARLHELLQAE